MRNSTLKPAYKTLAQYREKHDMMSELKWSKVSNQKIKEYKVLLDYFFAMNNKNLFHFYSIIFDNHKWDHREYNDGDRDIGLSKLYYQLILHKCVKTHGKKNSLFIKLDRRNSSTSLYQLQEMLNTAAYRDYGIWPSPVKQLVSEDSKKCDLLQLNDVVLGAVCAARNGRHLIEGGKVSKKELAEYVLLKSGLGTFEKDSSIGQKRFTVWNMRSRKK